MRRQIPWHRPRQQPCPMPPRMPRTFAALCALLLAAGLSGCKREDVKQAWLELCTGFAAPTGGLLVGRVHAGVHPSSPLPGETALRRVEETFESLEANPLSDVPLNVTVGGRSFSGIRTNDRGYLDLSPLVGFAPPAVAVHLELADAGYRADPLDEDLLVYDAEPGLAVLSDIDDTLLDSDVTHKAQMVKNAMLRSTWELRDFPDAARVVSAMAAGRPIFYVSGSPWGFRRRIGDFFQRQGFPRGPFLLKRFSSEPLLDQIAYKWQHISRVVDSLPNKRWLLLGDSGEKDPEIYASLREKRPDRVESIYIHLVTSEDPASPRFRDMRVFRNWSELLPVAK